MIAWFYFYASDLLFGWLSLWMLWIGGFHQRWSAKLPLYCGFMATRDWNAMTSVILFSFQSTILVLLSLFMVRRVFVWLFCFLPYLSSSSSFFAIIYSFCFAGFVGFFLLSECMVAGCQIVVSKGSRQIFVIFFYIFIKGCYLRHINISSYHNFICS